MRNLKNTTNITKKKQSDTENQQVVARGERDGVRREISEGN